MKVSAFMDYTKLENEIVKNVLTNKDTNKYRIVKFTMNDGHTDFERIGVTIDGHMIVFIPSMFWLLDCEALKRVNPRLHIDDRLFQNFIKLSYDMDTVNITSERRLVATGTAVIFANGNNEKIYINEKLLNVFKTGVELNYKGRSPKEPIFVYSCNDLIGAILPINVKNE